MDTQFRPEKEKQYLWLWISSLLRRRFFDWSRCIHPHPDFPFLDGRWKPFFFFFFSYGLSIKWPAYNCYVHETCKTSFPPHCLKYAGHFVLAPHKENLISLLTGCKGKGFKNEVWGAEGNVKSGMDSFMNTETYQANTTVQQAVMSHSSVKLLNEIPLVA